MKKINNGDRREVIKFSLFPKKIKSEWIWLEKYISIEEYKIFDYKDVYNNDGVTSFALWNAVPYGTYKLHMWKEVDRKLFIE